MTKRILALLLAVLLGVSCFALTACGGDDTTDDNKKPDDSTEEDNGEPNGGEPNGGGEEVMVILTIIKNKIDMVAGETDPIKVDSYAYITGVTATFESSNTAVATVDAEGTITAVAPGTATITVKGGDQTGTTEVTVREPWNPTDPDSAEVVAIMRNKDLANPTVGLYNVNVVTATDGGKEGTAGFCNIRNLESATAGPVEVWSNNLQFLFTMQKKATEGKNDGYDASAGHGQDGYDYSFQFYVREYNEADDRTEYTKLANRITAWSIYPADNVIYRCHFYDSGLLDVVEEGTTYDLVIVTLKGDEAVAWAKTQFTWTDSCATFVEYAEANPTTITK